MPIDLFIFQSPFIDNPNVLVTMCDRASSAKVLQLIWQLISLQLSSFAAGAAHSKTTEKVL